MKRIRVMIVEDSRVVREVLQDLMGRDPRLQVVAVAASGEEALRLLDRSAPDVISMDIRLPGMNGFEVTQQIMAQRPTPIVVVSASVEADDLRISMNALRAGALSVVEKPTGTGHRDYEAIAARICNELVNMSEVKVIRQRIDRGLRFGQSAPASETPRPFPLTPGPFRMVGIVASTGGPAALARLLGDLPRTFPLPILLVQHIAASFLEGFVNWLNEQSELSVTIALDHDLAKPGVVYVPPADHHLRVVGGRLRLDPGEPVGLHRPSGSVLFESMAQSLGSGGIGVILTGMGDDGAEGLRRLRASGGYTLAEDATTTVVYGMPRAAAQLGAVCESLPLPEIAPRLLSLVAADR